MMDSNVAKNAQSAETAPITIKKYANRRLYNTATSSYVTLDHLCQMVKEGVDFAVYDAKTGEDITRQVLTQIIVEEEAKGDNLLPISFLRKLISFYGHGLQWMVPSFLEHAMQSFSANQEKMAQAMQSTVGGVFPYGNLGELSQQNLAMFERAMRMFTPFAMSYEDQAAGQEDQATGAEENQAVSQQDKLEALQKQIDSLQTQLRELSEKQ
jgi:polyhydroxyalkanoate synthesis repressor PhaR